MNHKQSLFAKLISARPVSAALVFSMLVFAGTHALGQEKEVLSHFGNFDRRRKTGGLLRPTAIRTHFQAPLIGAESTQ